MPLTSAHLESMRDLVGCGRSRPIAWRQTQLKQLRSLVMSHEQEVITALALSLIHI